MIQRLILSALLFFYSTSFAQKTSIVSGSGIVLTTNGFIATNYHVIEGATKIEVDIFNGAIQKTYKADVIKSDNLNDLSIIKISDPSFSPFSTLPFTMKMSVNVGEKAFAMGYPQIGLQGTEVKVTDGIISSKTGFQNSNKEYQTSVPIQPGNSGGPLFDNSGNLIGINNAKIPFAENVSYAIKISYLSNLIDLISDFPGLPEKNTISSLPLPSKIKALSPYVVLIRSTVPACDKDLPSEQMKKINPSYTFNDINNLFGIKGVKTTETPYTVMYKWQFCGDDIINSIMVNFLNNNVQSIVKSFSNTNYSTANPDDIEKILTVNLTYNQVEKIFGTYGDVKIINFIGNTPQSIMCEWKFLNHDCYYVNFVDGKVLTYTKSKW